MGQGLLLRKTLGISQLVVNNCFSFSLLIFLGVYFSFLNFLFNLLIIFLLFLQFYNILAQPTCLLTFYHSDSLSHPTLRSEWLWGAPSSPLGFKHERNILNFIVNVIPCYWEFFLFVCIFPMLDKTPAGPSWNPLECLLIPCSCRRETISRPLVMWAEVLLQVLHVPSSVWALSLLF